MQHNKVKSFTLSEMLVVMIITTIVVGIAFSVLSLVQRQIRVVGNNFETTTTLSLFEQRLWQDFNQHGSILATEKKIVLTSVKDTVVYNFEPEYILRNSTDTIKLKVAIDKLYYLGDDVKSGFIDAVRISANEELPEYNIFVSMQYDASHFMNKDGF